jgi:hypothetical protein
MLAWNLRHRSNWYFPALGLLAACFFVSLLNLFGVAPAQGQQSEPSFFDHPPRSFQSLVPLETPQLPTRRLHGVRYKAEVAGTRPANASISASFPATCGSPHASYFGGPVISNVQIVVVYWNSNVNSTAQADLPAFYQGITNSSWFDLLSEYSTNITPSGGEGGTNQSIGRGSFAGAYTIVPALCPSSTTATCNLTDTQLQTELTTQITNGVLPPQQFDINGNENTLYMVYFPPNINLEGPQGAGRSCQQFCAYHNTFGTIAQPTVYGAVMDTFTGGCSTGCGPTGFEALSSTSAHEMAESVTDIEIGLVPLSDPDIVYPGAWFDNNNQCDELADICDTGSLTLPLVPTPTGSYYAQPIWSNALGACVQSGLHPNFNLAAPTASVAGVPFNFTLTALNPAGGLGTDTSYLGTVHFTSSDPAATLPADVSFTGTDQGTLAFQATLQAVDSQTITATDTVNSAITATSPVTVNNTFQVTVGTSPAGLAFTVDGTPYTSTQTFTWTVGAKHTLTAATQNLSAGIQDTFVSWSDGGSATHPVTASGRTTSYTATFSTAYQLTTAASPSTGGTVTPPSGSYYAPGTVVNLTASANTGFAFSNWTGPVSSAASAGTSVAMNAPQSVTANFAPTSAVSLSATSVAFGDQRVHTPSAEQSVTLTNQSGTKLAIDSIELTGAQPSSFRISNNCAARLAAGASCTIHLRFHPRIAGALSAVATITDRASGSPQSILLTGNGIGVPRIRLSSTRVDFGDQKVNTESAERTVTVTNTGTAPLVIDSIALTGPHASSFLASNDCGAGLAVDTSCTIDLRFYPRAKGEFTATVTITGDTEGPPKSITLSGSGK